MSPEAPITPGAVCLYLHIVKLYSLKVLYRVVTIDYCLYVHAPAIVYCKCTRLVSREGVNKVSVTRCEKPN